MKKIIIISSAILVLGLGLVLKRQHHEFKENNKEWERSYQEEVFHLSMSLEGDEKYLKEYEEGKHYPTPSTIQQQKILIQSYKDLIQTYKKMTKTSIENQDISFVSYVFNVIPKKILNYFK